MKFERDVVIVGGCGHVGFPLGLAFASRGLSVTLYDVNPQTVAAVNRGEIPFTEDGALEVLQDVVGDRLVATTDPSSIAAAEHVVIVIGTPVDDHLSPDPHAVPNAVEALVDHLVPGQLLILRSTVYPGVTGLLERVVERHRLGVEVAFCPERIAQGRAMTELFELPQIVSARTPTAVARATALFRRLTRHTVELLPEEAELAKLFTNVWRYVQFATANQLFMIANDFDLDFEKIRQAVAFEYPRAAQIPGAGLAAGPCLFKDTMQLATFDNNNFTLGHAAMLVNEGLPLYLVSRLEKQYHLEFMTVGILGMAFKAETDDIRSSLSYKLKRTLRVKAESVLCTDPYVTVDPTLLPLEEVIARSDLLVIGAPHAVYRDLQVDVPIVDIWNQRGGGVRV